MTKQNPTPPAKQPTSSKPSTEYQSDTLLKSLAPVSLDESLSPGTANADLGIGSATAASMSLFFAFNREASAEGSSQPIDDEQGLRAPKSANSEETRLDSNGHAALDDFSSEDAAASTAPGASDKSAPSKLPSTSTEDSSKSATGGGAAQGAQTPSDAGLSLSSPNDAVFATTSASSTSPTESLPSGGAATPTSGTTPALGVSAISDSDLGADAVLENASIGTQVGITAFAEDPDAGDSVTYSLTDDAGGRFAIDPETGIVTVAGTINHEDADSYTIEVTATSDDASTSKQSFTIAVGDVNETPTDLALSSASVAESQAGALVGTLSVTDEDLGEAYTFTVSDGRFEVVDAGGGVLQLKLRDGQAIDFETETSIAVNVAVEDSGGFVYNENFTLTVDDQAEVITLADGGASFVDAGVAETSITGGDGNDTIEGGVGPNTVLYGESLFDKELLFNGGGDLQVEDRDTSNGDTGVDTLINIETIQFSDRTLNVSDIQFTDGGGSYNGTASDDIIINGPTGDDIFAGDGNDIIYTGGGINNVEGGAGDDVFIQGSGYSMFLRGGTGTDTYYGGQTGDFGARVFFNDGFGDADIIYGGDAIVLDAYLDADDIIYGTANSDDKVFWYGNGDTHTLTYGVNFTDVHEFHTQNDISSTWIVDASTATQSMTVSINDGGDDSYTASAFGDQVYLGGGNDTFIGALAMTAFSMRLAMGPTLYQVVLAVAGPT